MALAAVWEVEVFCEDALTLAARATLVCVAGAGAAAVGGADEGDGAAGGGAAGAGSPTVYSEATAERRAGSCASRLPGHAVCATSRWPKIRGNAVPVG